MSTKTRIILLLLVLVLSLSVFANDPNLTITGTVTEVKIAGIGKFVQIDPKNIWEGSRYERTETWFEVLLRLNYCNRGEVSLILPLRKVFPNQMTKLLFLDMPSKTGSIAATVIGKSIDKPQTDFPARFTEDLKRGLPYDFKVIKPDTCFESMERIPIDSGFKVETVKKEKNKQDVEFARPEYPYFKLQYSYSMKDTLPVAEAKARWSKYGKLVTSADGDFFFETDVIINKLPD